MAPRGPSEDRPDLCVHVVRRQPRRQHRRERDQREHGDPDRRGRVAPERAEDDAAAARGGLRVGDGARLVDRDAHSRDPRIELEVEEVGDEVAEDHGHGQHEEGALQHRVVALQHRVVDGPSDPGPREDGLDQDRAGDDVAEREGDEGGDRQHRVPQRVAAHDRPRPEALGARRQDVVLPERLEHRRAHDQRVLAVQHEPERRRREDHVGEHVLDVRPPRRVEQELVRHAAGREHAGEDDDQHQPEPVRGHRVEAEGGRDADRLDRRSPPPGREHAGQRPDHDREARCRAAPSGSCSRSPISRLLETGWLFANETPRLPWTSCFR